MKSETTGENVSPQSPAAVVQDFERVAVAVDLPIRVTHILFYLTILRIRIARCQSCA